MFENVNGESNGDRLKCSNNLSQTFYVLRAFAIISVATAHLGSLNNATAETFKSMIGTIGVPVFLICSGYYFKCVESWRDFFIKRKKIIVPWLFLGLCTYILECQVGRSGGGYSYGLFRWVMGYLTWLYYIPVLLCFYVIFQFSTSIMYVAFWITVFVLFWILSYRGIISENNGLFTQYMIPFNHIGFFAFGIAIRKIDLNKFLNSNSNICFKSIVAFVYTIIFILYFQSGKIGYWKNMFSVPFEIMSFIVLFSIANSFRTIKIFYEIGKRTYFIFFIHMQVGMRIVYKALILLKLKQIPDFMQAIVNPILIVFVTYSLWKIMSLITHKLRISSKNWIIAV